MQMYVGCIFKNKTCRPLNKEITFYLNFILRLVRGTELFQQSFGGPLS